MLESLPNSSKLPFDLKAEVLARLISEQHDLSVEQLLHVPLYFFQRLGRKDVVGVVEDYSYSIDKPLVRIETSREGLFDTLPESIFFRPEEEFGNEVRKARALTEQEMNARKFLEPFEQAFFWLLLENELYEHNLEHRLENCWGQLFDTDTTSRLSANQKNICMQMLPCLRDIIGNWMLTAQWLELLTGQKIVLEEDSPPIFELPENLQKRLGDSILGLDFVLGETFIDGVSSINIILNDLLADEIIDYLPFGPKREILEDDFLSYLLPIETPYTIVLNGRIGKGYFTLNPENENNVLGYTLQL